MITINGTSLPIVATVCITPPKDDPTVFKNAINNIVTIAITKTIIILASGLYPSNSSICFANITPKAAIVPGKNSTVCIQPVKKPSFLP